METKKQTAVEWLVEQMNWDFCYDSTQKIIQQAKEMEKEHMKSTYIAGRSLGRFADPEDYYTSTYGL
jgi:hypothetical protein